ncbi:hypothetical protein F2981_09405 [Sinorhizobium meliloti]|nr:hypothetical protein [Sinorhizobium meliloti]
MMWSATSAAGPMAVTDHHAHAKLLASLLMSLRGTVCIYQGEELALAEAELAYEDLRIPMAFSSGPTSRVGTAAAHPMVMGESARWRLQQREAVGCRFPRANSAGGCPCRRATRPRCCITTAAFSPSERRIRPWPRARSNSSRPGAPCSASAQPWR